MAPLDRFKRFWFRSSLLDLLNAALVYLNDGLSVSWRSDALWFDPVRFEISFDDAFNLNALQETGCPSRLVL